MGSSFEDVFESVDPALYILGEGVAMWLGDYIDDEVRVMFNEYMIYSALGEGTGVSVDAVLSAPESSTEYLAPGVEDYFPEQPYTGYDHYFIAPSGEVIVCNDDCGFDVVCLAEYAACVAEAAL